MSNLLDYIKSLLPKFGRDKIMEISRQTQSELTTYVIPSYIEAEKGIAVRPMKSVKTQSFTNTLRKVIKVDKQSDNLVTIVRKSLEQISKNNAIIESNIDSSMEDEIVIAGVTVLKANLLRLIEVTSFVTRYSSKLLNYIYIVETAAVNGDTRYVQDSLSKGEVLWIEERFVDFAHALAVLTKSDREISTILKNLPEITIDGEVGAVSATLGETKFDPFGFKRLSNFTNNPILHVGLIIAQYQATRYKEQKETRLLLQLRLMNLTSQTPNAKLEKEIEYIQARIDRLSDEIRRAEEEA